MASPALSASGPTVNCSKCGTALASGAKFCPKCGASATPAPPTPGIRVVTTPRVSSSARDEIGALEQNVAQNPNDESYKKLLAVALHDDAMKDWWEDPKDKSLLCTSYEGVTYARRQLKRAAELQFNDPALRKEIDRSLRLADSMEKRKFVGSWLMVVVLGFFYIVPGVIWWLVNRRPQYLINKDYMTHVKTGKHAGAAAKMGGIQGKIYEFFENINESWGWLLGLFFMLTIGVVLSPIFMILAYKQNYLDVKKATT